MGIIDVWTSFFTFQNIFAHNAIFENATAPLERVQMQSKSVLHWVDSDAIVVLDVAHDKGANCNEKKLGMLSTMI